MKTIVIYQSSTGFTKQYAEWIAKELQADVISIKNVDEKRLSEYDVTVFGGWVMGGMIIGLDKIRKMSPKKLVIFAVGSTPDNLISLESMKEQNKISFEAFFYMIGGFRYDNLNFLKRGMLKIIKKSVGKKENKSPVEQYMADILGTSFDSSSPEYIKPLVDYMNNL